jgi:hypothetical protein
LGMGARQSSKNTSGSENKGRFLPHRFSV